MVLVFLQLESWVEVMVIVGMVRMVVAATGTDESYRGKDWEMGARR